MLVRFLQSLPYPILGQPELGESQQADSIAVDVDPFCLDLFQPRLYLVLCIDKSLPGLTFSIAKFTIAGHKISFLL